ncbi:MAG: hypothetical protein AB2672_17905 [Candidatus Thiodiazotropha endolucinida]|nr:hypothetical protein [Candidatus Thiodiazotropha taylori]MCW4223961.1 hypothetical protein [Candidatus Thiodiazotropha endolucinida]MCG7883756.1 hypothetical protein [Candidatus Thiodiazotropha taylori]MCG7885539.1 hypothetical protein [Candidatus Thiodiazotropha taylori]MCG7892305.1 hypothetical protein [Candidatus Thiodiazotropha taylori]
MTSYIKQSVTFSLAALSLLFHTAHAAPGMSEQQMQQMMMRAQEAEECFSKIDKSQLEELEAKGKKMQADIKALCAAGKRDEAMSKAFKYSKQINNDPKIKEMRKCSEKMRGMMVNMPQPYMPPTVDEREKAGHVCDDM